MAKKKKQPEIIDFLNDDSEVEDEEKIDVDNDGFILLVYPFAGDRNQIEAAADGLNEASGINHLAADTGRCLRVKHQEKLLAIVDNRTGATKEKLHRRGHKVVVMVKDCKQLEPEQWLNDSLIDFWMQW
jgi:hypothetical protein